MPIYPSYPVMEINVKQIRDNTRAIVNLCAHVGIDVCGVVKGSEMVETGYGQISCAFIQGGCQSLGDSRIDTIKKMREAGIQEKILLLRLPMLSEVSQVITYADMSLNAHRQTLDALHKEAVKQNKVHGVILMMDLGDLREGYFHEEDLFADALYVEKQLSSTGFGGLHLLGIGTNLGCYGAVKPDTVNLGRLVKLAGEIEDKIGRKLEVVSGGATSTLPLVKSGIVPLGINHLRIGEGILNNRDLPDIWKVKIGNLHNTNFVIHAEVIEVKEKASHPIGEIFIDAFGNRPTYEDRDLRKRALLGIGKRDIGSTDSLIPRLDGVEVIGGSSDHLILDITSCQQNIQVGDILSFDTTYCAMLYGNQSPSVKKYYLE